MTLRMRINEAIHKVFRKIRDSPYASQTMAAMKETATSSIHIPVLPEKVLEALAPVPGGHYLDGTLGLGGHAGSILEYAPDSEICALDRDGSALGLARERLARFEHRVHYFHLPFADFPRAIIETGWKSINGAILDLGVSSLQIDTAERGFSFLEKGPLDMRMDQNGGKSAEYLVNKLPFEELKRIIAEYGEDPQAGRIARRIVEERKIEPFRDTGRLASVVRSAYPAAWRRNSRNHPATRTFQALRLAVNDELGQLERFLAEILKWLAPGGRLAIISFHSLEDRIVKNAMRHWASGCICSKQIPVCVCGHVPEVRILYKKPLTASAEELERNPRASSAKLRAVEKLGDMTDDNS